MSYSSLAQLEQLTYNTESKNKSKHMDMIKKYIYSHDQYISLRPEMWTELEEKKSTLSMMLSITSSERFIPDSASVATTICFTYSLRYSTINSLQMNALVSFF